jgi:hypothetical protein
VKIKVVQQVLSTAHKELHVKILDM